MLERVFFSPNIEGVVESVGNFWIIEILEQADSPLKLHVNNNIKPNMWDEPLYRKYTIERQIWPLNQKSAIERPLNSKL